MWSFAFNSLRVENTGFKENMARMIIRNLAGQQELESKLESFPIQPKLPSTVSGSSNFIRILAQPTERALTYKIKPLTHNLQTADECL